MTFSKDAEVEQHSTEIQKPDSEYNTDFNWLSASLTYK